MELVILALSSLSRLMSNPALGGGGSSTAQNIALIGHLVQLLHGGTKTAAALKEFAEQIKDMADRGATPTQRDFDAMTARLTAALAVVDEAKKKVRSRKSPPPGEPAPPLEMPQS
jgi:hypothetical protein